MTMYGIIANPNAGVRSANYKYQRLLNIKNILGVDTIIEGLDTKSAAELCETAKCLAEKVDILIVAGGDGTLNQIVNALDNNIIYAFLPMGSGNLVRHELNYQNRSICRISKYIKNAQIREIDLVHCTNKEDNGRVAFASSIGIDGTILKEREWLRDIKKLKGLPGYALATMRSIKKFELKNMAIFIDGNDYHYENVLDFMVMKARHYGYGLNVNPRANLFDGKLHTLVIRSYAEMAAGLATSILPRGSRFGEYMPGENIIVSSNNELVLQCDGEIISKGHYFEFNVKKKYLKIKF
ncbi:hypothetical protein J4468_04820 [Candidatus Woesearchaeota archaeon]|nr:hypothetical protein [Candidatus Woesearchaeota archaeon]